MTDIEWIRTRQRFEELREDWDRLASAQETPFARHAWLGAWWAAFGGDDLEICASWSNGTLAAVFPLRLAGRRLEAPANGHTPLFAPFARHDRDLADVIEAVLNRRVDLVVPSLPGDRPALSLLARQAARAGRPSVVTALYDSPIVQTAGVTDFGTTLSPKTRRELGRLRRKATREHEVEFALLARPSDLERELQGAFELEASGWKGAEGTAVLSSPATARFYRDVVHAFHAEDRVRLSSMSVDGHIVAFDLCLLDHNRLYGLKSGFDESYRRLGPSLVLRLAEIERCCEAGIDAFELLGTADEYKLRFATAQRRHYVFHSYSRRPVSLARYAYRRSVRPVLRDAYHRLADTPGRFADRDAVAALRSAG